MCCLVAMLTLSEHCDTSPLAAATFWLLALTVRSYEHRVSIVWGIKGEDGRAERDRTGSTLQERTRV